MKSRYFYFFLLAALPLFILLSCKKSLTPPADEEVLDGPIQNLSTPEIAQFLRGDVAFNEVFTAETGLGSIFVASSCAGCHAGDGKGHLSTMLTRFGQSDSTGNKFMHLGGPQLQHRALPGYAPEQIPVGASFTRLNAPAVTGLGYLSFVSDADLLALADPYDANGDGISGVPNWIQLPAFVAPNPEAITRNGKYIGRFGKKASAYNLMHQTVNAYNQDMGIASYYENHDVATGMEVDPEVSIKSLQDLVFYLHTLKAPLQRNIDDEAVRSGKEVFTKINCGACHVEKLKTGNSPIAVLANKEFYPYSDFLLHDMGSSLDDGYTEGTAATAEWRTPALWGLGLSADSQGGQFFLMHDGRARSIEDAILMHGGEAEQSKMKYMNLSANDKEALLKFLKSL
jgi:CxxC motif-containing protein (DUF1111 family)